jgi:NADH dehydrogenase
VPHKALPQVVILGGGFAGIGSAIALQKLARRGTADIHLVSDENYFVFQPLLPEVVAARLEPTHILNPIRQLCPAVHFHCAKVKSVDLPGRKVFLQGSDGGEECFPYDHLVLGMGVSLDLSSIPGLREHAMPIKTLGDAFHLRNHILRQLEIADLQKDDAAARRALTFVVIGGGFSGVETIAEVNDMIKSVLHFYRRASRIGHRMVLIHSRDRILNELGDELAVFAQDKLRSRGVEIITGTRVKEVTPNKVILPDGTEIETSTVVCSVGNAPLPMLAAMNLPLQKGRIDVDEHLRVRGHTGVWSLGDCAAIPDVKRGGLCPPTAQYALRQGKRCAENIAAEIAGRPTKPFSFGGLGQLAVVGHHCGVAQVMGFKFAGLLAWFFWRTVYWSKLPGMRCKIRVGIDWALDLFFPRDITMLQVRRSDTLARAHYKAGEVIFHQGDPGDLFYMIETGEVEILVKNNGEPEKMIRKMGPGESFGELALMGHNKRTATVRCVGPVNVIAMKNEDFSTMIGSFGFVRDHFAGRKTDLYRDLPGGPSRPEEETR